MLDDIAKLGHNADDAYEALAAEWAENLTIDSVEKYAAVYVGEKVEDADKRRKAAFLTGALALGTGVTLGLSGKNGLLRTLSARRQEYLKNTEGLRNVGKQLQDFGVKNKAYRDAKDAELFASITDPVRRSITKNTYDEVARSLRNATTQEQKDAIMDMVKGLKVKGAAGDYDITAEAQSDLLKRLSKKDNT